MLERLNPINKRVLAKRVPAEKKTEAGLYVPTQAQEKAQLADVVAVANDCITLRQGMQVYFGKYAGVQVDEEYLILKEEEVLGWLEPEDNAIDYSKAEFKNPE